MRKLIFLILSFSLFFSSVSYAGLPQAVTSYAVTITNVVKTGVGASANFFFKKAANDPSFASPAASVTNKSMATGFIKRFAKFGLLAVGYYAIEQLLDGTDWVMGEGGRITKNKPSINNYAFCPSASFDVLKCFTTPAEYLREATRFQYVNHDGNYYSNISFKGLRSDQPVQDVSNLVVPYAMATIEYTYDYSSDSNPKSVTYPNDLGVYVVHAPDTLVEKEITADELADLIKAADADQLAQIIQPQPNVAPAEDPAYDDLYSPPAADAIPDTHVDPNPNPDPDTGECPTGYTKAGNLCVQDPVTDPETPPNPEGLPAFCSWASGVCEFMNWVKTEPTEPPDGDGDITVEIPEATMHEPILERLYINMPAQCPPDPVLEFMNARIPFPMSVFCQFATMMKPLILLFAYIKGLSIIGTGLS